MKQSHLFLAALAVALLVTFGTSCIRLDRPAEKAAEIGSGAGYRLFSVEDFNTLMATGVDIYVTVGQTDGIVRIEADDFVAGKIEVENRGRNLAILDRHDIAGKAGAPRARAFVSAATLHRIYATNADVVLDRPVEAERYETNGSIRVDSLAVHAQR